MKNKKTFFSEQKIKSIIINKRRDKSLLSDNMPSQFNFVKPQESSNNLFGNRTRVLESQEPKSVVFIPQTARFFSGKTGSFKHSGDIGDLIYSLPVLRNFGGGTLYLNPHGLSTNKPDGTKSGFNSKLIEILKPLLMEQYYIKDVVPWNDDKVDVDVDIDYFRSQGNVSNNLCHKILNAFSVPFSETEIPWISCKPKKIASCVVARSFRYRDKNMDYSVILDEFKDDVVFVGLPDEHKDFQERFGKIAFYQIENFLDLAQVINGSELFVGNQSSPMSIAIALHKPFVQECFPNCSDCIFDFEHARYFK